MLKRRSPSSVKTASRHLRPYVDIFYEIRTSLAHGSLSGESPAIRIRGFFESLQDRCRAVPAAEKEALSTWGDSLVIDLPLANPAL